VDVLVEQINDADDDDDDDGELMDNYYHVGQTINILPEFSYLIKSFYARFAI